MCPAGGCWGVGRRLAGIHNDRFLADIGPLLQAALRALGEPHLTEDDVLYRAFYRGMTRIKNFSLTF